MTKLIIGLLLVVGGIASGLYVGLWLCFIGGIVDVIQQIRADELVALTVAIGVAKVLFAGIAGWVSALLFIAPGAALIKSA